MCNVLTPRPLAARLLLRSTSRMGGKRTFAKWQDAVGLRPAALLVEPCVADERSGEVLSALGPAWLRPRLQIGPNPRPDQG